MSDHADMIPSVIAAAIAAAGPKGTNEAAWRATVNDAIPHVVSMMGDGSRQWKIAEEVMGAAVFVATYVDHKVEESSTRVVVHIDTGKATKNYPDGIEPIRTHRTDNAQGRSMKERLDKLTKGDEIVVWKAMESMGDGADANKVRVLVHFETRPKRNSSPGRGEAAGTAVPAGGGRSVESSSIPAAADSGPSSSPLAERFNELGGKVKVEVVKRLRAEGITFPEPGIDDADRFIILIGEVEKDHG